MYHMGFSFTEAWNIPIAWRRWFIERLNRENELQKQQQEGQSASDGYSKLVSDALGNRKSFK